MKALTALRRQLRLLIGRGVVRLVNDAGGLQQLQVELYEGELRVLDRIQNYGYTSVPHEGAEVITGSVGGARNHSVVVCVDDRRFRLKGLKKGEVALYTDEGDTLHFKRGRLVEINAGSAVVVNAPVSTFNGNLQVNGAITATQAIHSGVSVSAPSVIAGFSLTVNGIQVLDHDHMFGSISVTGPMQ